eukprot:scaffold277875_cov17-Tisochrysis_lutea.AAC.1
MLSFKRGSPDRLLPPLLLAAVFGCRHQFILCDTAAVSRGCMQSGLHSAFTQACLNMRLPWERKGKEWVA